jgi:uncharacterized protein (TIGR03086 family)
VDEVLARFEAALDVFDTRVHEVPEDRWSAPTPCSEWDVRALVNHVVGELLWAAPLVEGRTIAEVGDQFDGDVLGADPSASWHRASGAAHSAFAEPGALARTVHLSYGDEPAVGYCEQLTSDVLVHAWDLSRGAGLDDRLPDDLVDWALGWVEPLLPMFDASGLFGTAVEPATDAGDQTRLLARLGRDPS